MENLTETLVEAQAVNQPEEIGLTPPRKVGFEIVPTVALSSRFFHGPRRTSRRGFALGSDQDWMNRVATALR